MSWHCRIHDIRHPEQSQCPVCRADEAAEHRREIIEQSEAARDEASRRHDELLHWRKEDREKRRNPGDYSCPKCLYVTLKRGASRCPMCQAEITRAYWNPIYTAEQARADEEARREKLAAEERSRGEPERQRRAAIARERALRLGLMRNLTTAFAISVGVVIFWMTVPNWAVGQLAIETRLEDAAARSFSWTMETFDWFGLILIFPLFGVWLVVGLPIMLLSIVWPLACAALVTYIVWKITRLILSGFFE